MLSHGLSHRLSFFTSSTSAPTSSPSPVVSLSSESKLVRDLLYIIYSVLPAPIEVRFQAVVLKNALPESDVIASEEGYLVEVGVAVANSKIISSPLDSSCF